MDSIRYLVSILPDNPENLRNGSYGLYKDRLNGGKMKNIPYELRDDDDSYSGTWAANFRRDLIDLDNNCCSCIYHK